MPPLVRRLGRHPAARPWLLGLWFGLLALPLMYSTDPGYRDPYGWHGVHRAGYVALGLVVVGYLWQLDQRLWPRLSPRGRRRAGLVAAAIVALAVLVVRGSLGEGVDRVVAELPGGSGLAYLVAAVALVYTLRGLAPDAAADGEPAAGRWWARHRRWAAPLGLLALLIAPLFMNRYVADVAVQVGIYVTLALGLNIVVGLAGLLDLGYVAFYAVGAYTYGLLSKFYDFSFWWALPLGGALAAVFGVLLGIPVLRLRGDYLAIVTLGFGEIIRIVLNNWDELTNGPNGIIGIPKPTLPLEVELPVPAWLDESGVLAIGGVLRTPHALYYVILLIALVTVFVVNRLNHSRVGRAWIALREDEVAAEAMGIDTTKAKLLAFGLGATWAGFAGTFFAAKQSFISPESFTFFESVIILSMVVLGGMGSIPGVILGAAALVVLPEVTREFAQYRMLIFGAAMVAMMVLRPQGFVGSARRAVELRGGEQPAAVRAEALAERSLYEARR
ncbi:MAG TPA: high-affinity branched-chain amino acid ABC transporter permease LivM [Thermodesulfobacteriota bacterium]|nr:high-affinity branched-chain amino acid ABC transporter permease LivM [Thermodesulfobacteriota bacterium]